MIGELCHKRGSMFESRLPGLVILTVILFCLVPLSLSKADLITSDSSSTSITLHWTSPGDDGDQGTASIYDVRYSTSMITDQNWNAAAQVDNEPLPQVAGSQETFTVIGLQPSAVYYFAIKTADEAGNWSALSNIACDTTLAEQIPPAAIVDLQLTNPTGTTVTLIWTAPGDDSSQGIASEYDIRYSTAPITQQNWHAATQVSGEPSPKSAGSQETFTVTGLQSEVTYYFAIKTADEVPNWSGLSNVVNATTPDQIPPAAINDLSAVTGENIGEIVIHWCAPGDDSLQGLASAYSIRLSLEPITEANWHQAFEISDPPAPLGPGSPQSFTIGGLVPGSIYYVAIKSIDNYANISGLSNIDTAVAQWHFAQDVNGGLATVPDMYSLSQNYPNPFNPTTCIRFGLPQPGRVRLDIFDGAGRFIISLIDGCLPAGYHEVRWDGRDNHGQSLASGIYFSQLRTEQFADAKKMLLIK